MYDLIKIINSKNNKYHLGLTVLSPVEKAFERFINNNKNLNLLLKYNDEYEIQPVQAFILLTYVENKEIFVKGFSGSKSVKNKSKQRFGKVVGEFFYFIGYTKEKKAAVGSVNSASLYSRGV